MHCLNPATHFESTLYAVVNWCVLRLSQIRISFRLDPEQSGQRRRAISYLLLLILHRRRPEEHQELIKLVDTIVWTIFSNCSVH